MPRHGGDLGQAARLFPAARPPWRDLSTGINPWPYPVADIDPGAWTRLPEQAAMAALLAAARGAYRVAPGAVLVAAPGTEILIAQMPRLLAPTTVAVVAPTYGDHAAAWGRAGHRVVEVAEPLSVTAPVVVLCQPNNPDGRTHDPDGLLALADRCAARGGMLVVDEAYADVAPDRGLADRAGRPGLVILRSFGKFFGLGGLRLGFALGDAAVVAGLEAALGSWAVAGPALVLGARALADADWQAATRRRLAAAAADLDQALRAGGLRVVGGTDLFRLAAHPEAPALWRHLAAAGLWVRSFAYEPTWLRFGLPPDAGTRRRLVAALADFRG